MSEQSDNQFDAANAPDSPVISEAKTRRSRSLKEKGRSRSRIRDDGDTISNDPDYSPYDELGDGSGDISTCSTPVEEKCSPIESTPALSSPVFPCSGTICSLCYCGEKSLLGQGDLTRYDPTPSFNPFRKPSSKFRSNRDSYSGHSPGSDFSDRSAKSPSRGRSRETRHSRDSNSRQSESRPVEVVEELQSLGCPEIADPNQVFEPTGHVTAHHCCAAWSEGVTQNELYQLLSVDKAVHHGMAQRCSYCNNYGATIKCKATRCDKLYHYPCAAGSGCFQDIKSMLMLCPDHLEQAPSIGAPEELNCAVCDDMGEISDFLFCTSCGHHYHGQCLHPYVSVNPVVRAGWQCPDCKICQTCRQPGDDNKMLVCDSCDKGYHTYCLQPAMPFIPKNGWCCQSCRRCTDCGSRSAGSGPSSRWHHNYQVCDGCYQQRNKGLSCPVCGKAYRANVQRDDMMHCNGCKKWIHEDCDDSVDMDAYCEMGSSYTCPSCRNEQKEIEGEYQSIERLEFEAVDLPPPPPDHRTPAVDQETPTSLQEPAKRMMVSSSVDSDKSSSAMKGSSNDPMLFTSGKQRTPSEEVVQPQRSLVDRKSSSDSHLGAIFDADPQYQLGLFSGDAFQPIVSVPMLYEEQQVNLHKDGVEWPKKKLRQLSGQRSPVKIPQKPSPSGTSPDYTPTALSPRQNLGKPGGIYGKGKPFGARKRTSAVRSRGKGRGARRHRQGSMSSNLSASSGVPSPTSALNSSQPGAGPVSSGMARRRSRTRWRRQESTTNALAPPENFQESPDEEYGDSMHNTVVLCSADDDFTLNQDMCVVCGSFGLGAEGRLIACSQCGQCYHPYCVNLKLTKVVLRKGWRCLDCTVCEECGAADDPSHLLLCDDCDISYHTYCLKPPLQHVPKGGWKCKWCVRCNHCGTTTPGTNCDWAENYTLCGPCASLNHCPICRRLYRDEDIIMQCSNCERWLHSSCEYLYNESDIEKVLEKGYTCLFCRPKGSTPPHLDLNPPQTFDGDPMTGLYIGRTRSDAEQVKEYHKDGVALTSAGLQHIQQLMQKAMGLHKKKAGVQRRKSHLQKQVDRSNSIEMKSASQDINSGADGQAMKSEDGLNTLEKAETMDPIKVEGHESALLPELETGTEGGVSIQANDSLDSCDLGNSPDPTKQVLMGVKDGGVKRRRKPYRPGIGGFMVRQRGRGGFIGSRGRRGRYHRGGSSTPTISGAPGFDTAPSNTDDVKLRATEITGECGSSYIKHEMEGGITIAHADPAPEGDKPTLTPEDKSEGQTSMLLSPLRLKISTVSQPPTQQKKKKKRSRLIDQFPPYIQEGFFGPTILAQAKLQGTSNNSVISIEESKVDLNKKTVKSDSQILLPENVRLRLDSNKAADAKIKNDLKQDRHHSRMMTSGDDDPMMIDKESEDLLGVLPDDLPFKDDDLLGILSGSKGGQDSHENILSPSALETLVNDGLATMDGDMTSLFPDILSHTQDGATGNDESALGDLSKSSEVNKAAPEIKTEDSIIHQDSSHDVTMSTALELEQTEAILDQITAAHTKEMEQSEAIAKQNDLKQQQQQIHGQMKRQQIQQQHLQMQQQRMQQGNFGAQQPTNAQQHSMQLSRPMFHDANVAPNIAQQPGQQQMVKCQQPVNSQQTNQQPLTPQPVPNQMVPSNQQQPVFMNQHTAIQGPSNQQVLVNQAPHMLQQTSLNQQQFIGSLAPGEMTNQNPMTPTTLVPMTVNIGSHQNQMNVNMQPSQLRMMGTTGPLVQMFGNNVGNRQPQALSRPGSGLSQPSVPHSPALSIMESADSPRKTHQSHQVVSVSNLPDLTSDSNIFEPAPPPWPLGTDLEGDTLSVNQRNILKWEKDEPLGPLATISPVLYANMQHPYLKKEYPDWQTRAKQVAKLWRKATSDERAPFLQKARDNRALLKSRCRGEVLELNEQDLLSIEMFDQEDEQKTHAHQPHRDQQHLPTGDISSQLNSLQHDTSMMTHGMMPTNQQQMQQSRTKGNNQGQSSLHFGNFVKPRPYSREPTPKPASPGATPMGSNRSKSPFVANTLPSSPLSRTPRPPGMTGDNIMIKQQADLQHFPGQANIPNMQPGVVAQQRQAWQNQQNSQLSLRMPKMETIDPAMSQQPMRFPQSSLQQPLTPGQTPLSLNSPGTPIQRQGSFHEFSESGANQDSLGRVQVTPRPGMPPQLLPQAVSPAMRPLSPHPMGMRTQGPMSQPATPQPMITMRDPFMDIAAQEKPSQRRMSAPDSVPSANAGTIPNAQTNMQNAMMGPTPNPETGIVARSEEERFKMEAGEKMVPVGVMQGTVGRPQIREILRHTTQRRYKLLEQQSIPGGSWANPATRPPPPYPSQSPSSQTANPGSFAFPPNIKPERFPGAQGQAMQISGPRMPRSVVQAFRPGMPPSPSFSQSLHPPPNLQTSGNVSSFGVERFPPRTPTPNSSAPSPSVHNIAGQVPVTGGYIELRHSTQPDPAVRREQIIRAGAVLPVSSTVTQPNLSPATPKDIKPAISQLASTSTNTSVAALLASSVPSASPATTKVEATAIPPTTPIGSVPTTVTTSAQLSEISLKSVKSEPFDQTSASAIGFQTAGTTTLQRPPETTSTENSEQNSSGNKVGGQVEAAMPTVGHHSKPNDKLNQETHEGTKVDERTETTLETIAPSVSESVTKSPVPKIGLHETKTTETQQDNVENTDKTQQTSGVEEPVTAKGADESDKATEHNDQKNLSEEESSKMTDSSKITNSPTRKESSLSSVQATTSSTKEDDPQIRDTDNRKEERNTNVAAGVVTKPADDEKNVEQSSENQKENEIDVSVSGDLQGKDGHYNSVTEDKMEKQKKEVVDTVDNITEKTVSKSREDEEKQTKTLTSGCESETVKSADTKEPENPPKSTSSEIDESKLFVSTSKSMDTSGTTANNQLKPVENVGTTAVSKTTIPATSTAAEVLLNPNTPAQLSVPSSTDITSLTCVCNTTPTFSSTTEQIQGYISHATAGMVKISSTQTPVTTLSLSMQAQQPTVPGFAMPNASQTVHQNAVKTEISAVVASSLSEVSAASHLHPPTSVMMMHATSESNAFINSTVPVQQAPINAQHPPPTSKTKKPLLIKEQPLILQDLLDEEKREQERARREKINQVMMQQQQQQVMLPVFSGEVEQPDVSYDKIMQAKLKVLSGINQVINSSTTSQAGPQGTFSSGPVVQHPTATTNWTSVPSGLQNMPPQGASSGSPPVTEGDSLENKKRYEEFLIQHQALIQMQLKQLEQVAKQQKSAKLALTKKQRLSRKNGEELSPIDAETLTMVSKQQIDTQHKLDEIRKEQLRHSERVQDYNMKQGSVPFVPITVNRPVSVLPQQGSSEMVQMVSPQQLQIPQQAQGMIRPSAVGAVSNQLPSVTSRVAGTLLNTPSSLTGSNIVVAVSTPNVSSSMVQSVFSTPATVVSGAQNVTGTSGPMSMQQQEALFAQLQKMPGLRQMNPSQVQQIMQHGAIISGSTTYPTFSNPNPVQGESTPKQLGTVPSSPHQQLMMPSTSGQIDPSRGQHAQVASVNINIGGNMTVTQGLMKPIHTGAGEIPVNTIPTSSYMQMPQFMSYDRQQMTMMQQQNSQEEKPKRRRKKKKKTTSADSTIIEHQMVTQNSMPGSIGMHMSNSGFMPRVSSPGGMFMTSRYHPASLPAQFGTPHMPGQHVAPVMNSIRTPMNITNASSAVPLTTVFSTQPVSAKIATSMVPTTQATNMNLKLNAGSIGAKTLTTTINTVTSTLSSAVSNSTVMTINPTMSIISQTATTTTTSSIVFHESNIDNRPMTQPSGLSSPIPPSPTAPTFDKMPLPGSSPTMKLDHDDDGSTTASSAPPLLVARQPVWVNEVKKDIVSPQPINLNRSLVVATPPHLSGLTESELEIILATDPDARSRTATPDTPSQVVPFPLKSGRPSTESPLDPDRENSIALVDDTISAVIRDGMEYGDRLQKAKQSGLPVSPPSWMRDPKPTKFPPKPPTPNSQIFMKTSHSQFIPGYGPPLSTNHQELLRHMLKPGSVGASMPTAITSFAGLEKAGTDMNLTPEQLKKHMELLSNPYLLNKDGMKKKRSRRASKDKDAKSGVKKKRKKKNQDKMDEELGADGSHSVAGMIGLQISQSSPAGKNIGPWKQLPLLSLVEPDMKINYDMCMPKGTGLTRSKSLLEGMMGKCSYRGLPDYYDLIECKDPLKFMNPPTPPSSLPPSPKRERADSADEMKMTISCVQHVKVPDSLPTPPHIVPEPPDDASKLQNEDLVAPSSPEPEDSKSGWSLSRLSSMKAIAYKDDSIFSYQAASPELPVLPKPRKTSFEDKDQVTVTISFKSATSKAVKKSLTQLSRALGTSIVSFTMVDSAKDDAKSKSGQQAAKSKNEKADDKQLSNQTNADSGTASQRKCFHCSRWVVGNGVRKPLFGVNLAEEDLIFCNKDCFFAHHFNNKNTNTHSPKKKWKATQVYQRRTRKIDITSLINSNPDPEYVSTRGRSVIPYMTQDSYDDVKSADGKARSRGRRRGSNGPGEESRPTSKRWKGIKWKRWNVNITVVKATAHKQPPDVDALLTKYGSALKPPTEMRDTRKCVLCGLCGDGDTKGVARLLNLDVDSWIHLNCALWSAEVYETQGGALINVDIAVRNSLSALCVVCQKKGATIHCNRSRCSNSYHCACALQCGCHFYKDKTVLCPVHGLASSNQTGTPQHNDQQLKSLAVFRKVYVQRKETKQIASIMQQGELTQGEKNYILRVGALMFYAVGQLSTHQMTQFHSKTAIYPIGYKATRIYWSCNNTRKRSKYMCMITEKDGKPWFTTRYQAVASRPKSNDKNLQGEWMEMQGPTLNDQWRDLLEQLSNLRTQQKMLKLFPDYINGENIYGLTSPVVCRILESLPNIELCANYKFRYGRSPILELPLAINPTGCARSEPHIKHSRKKPHTLISNLISEYYESTGIGDASSSLYGKQFVHSKSSQYRRMKSEWRNNVNLARSRIQGLGLFASRDIEPGTMVIEYIGEIIRSEVAEKREKKYEAANRGVYMFRLDSDYIVDATVTGGPARYINHACNPNCVAEVVNFEKEKKIMIISNRHILSGEELNYDYKFDFEDEGNKIPCLCGSINCRKWMN
ncbi:unnamed protein product [Clavelina lepadiformis]|uniref:[histone H3]-lysine(4) N-methyltransferase n=1 Tax=Clavelina lepadiformis TaxID=159417 RepID=A0ABP0EW79_CLALP